MKQLYLCSVEVGEWIAVAYTDQPYIGIVKEVADDQVTTEFMAGGMKLKWPARPDIDQHPINIVLQCRPVVVPDVTGRFSIITNRENIHSEYTIFSEKYF